MNPHHAAALALVASSTFTPYRRADVADGALAITYSLLKSRRVKRKLARAISVRDDVSRPSVFSSRLAGWPTKSAMMGEVPDSISDKQEYDE